ncbi:hypothetical protein BH18ACI4_BH18ACI4_21540 [soil metagenome]
MSVSLLRPTRYREVVLTSSSCSLSERLLGLTRYVSKSSGSYANLCFNFTRVSSMAQSFAPGDDLIFQLESGYGLLRVVAVDRQGSGTVWHLLAYEDFYPTVEAAEEALKRPGLLTVRKAHLALTDRAFERTPAALLGNRPVSELELLPYRQWLRSEGRVVSDRSALLMLGIR